MAYNVIPGARHGSTFFTCGDGYYYKYISISSAKTHYDCYKATCAARVWSVHENNSITFSVNPNFPTHNHGSEPHLQSVWELREKIIRRVVSESIAPRRIFEEECVRAGQEVAAHLSLKNMESGLQKLRRRNFPRLPSSAVELDAMLAEEQWGNRFGHSLSGKPFYRGNVIVEGKSNMIFVSEDLKEVLTTSKEIHIDGTFKVVPKVPHLKQLLVIMAMAFDHAFPVCLVLMESRTTPAYSAVFERLKTLVGNINAEIIMSDYEAALMNAIRAAFPNATSVGCWWHFSNRILKKIKDLRMLGNVRRSDQFKKAMLMCMALPLLPHDAMQEGLEEIRQYAGLGAAQQALEPLFQYIQRVWLNRIGARTLSVHGLPRRTNNDSESFNMILQREIGQNHPEAWNFLEHLKKIESTSSTNFIRAKNGLQFTRDSKKRTFLLKDATIKRASRDLSDGRITILEFLLSVSSVLGRAFVIPEDGDVEEEEEEEEEEEVDDVQEVVAGPQLPIQPEQPEQAEQEEIQWMERLADYRLKRTVLAFAGIADCPPQEFVRGQLGELAADLETLEETAEAEAGSAQPVCNHCLTNVATRVAVPCGHWAGCSACCLRLVRTPIHFTIQGGVELVNFRLPIRCHQCNCLIGKLIRVF